jgi:uncharacterized protein with beta-barrel porin domain
VQTGYDFNLPKTVVLTPFIGLQFGTYTQSALTESGGPLALSVQQASASSVVSQLGGQFAGRVHVGGLTVSTQAELGWAHEYASTARNITASFIGAPATPFTVNGAAVYRNHALVGLGVATAMTTEASLFLRYDGAINGTDTAQAISGGFRYLF